MKISKWLLILIIMPLFAFTSLHKYYISVTQIDYIKEKKSIQIISRIFIDDFENVIRDRYDEGVVLAVKNESPIIDSYIERYLTEKLKIKINNKGVILSFIGKEYEGDIMRCYLEVENINNIESIEITNQILFDLFNDQQNIVKTKINSKQKSYILTLQEDSAMLKFN